MDKHNKNRSRSRDRIDRSRKSRSRSRDKTDRYVKNRSQQKNSSSQDEIRDWHSEDHQKSHEGKKSSDLEEKREIVKKLTEPSQNVIESSEKNGNLPIKVSDNEKLDSQQFAAAAAASDTATEKSEKHQSIDPLAKYAKRTVGDAFIEAQQRYFRRKMLQKPAIVVGDNDWYFTFLIKF